MGVAATDLAVLSDSRDAHSACAVSRIGASADGTRRALSQRGCETVADGRRRRVAQSARARFPGLRGRHLARGVTRATLCISEALALLPIRRFLRPSDWRVEYRERIPSRPPRSSRLSHPRSLVYPLCVRSAGNAEIALARSLLLAADAGAATRDEINNSSTSSWATARAHLSPFSHCRSSRVSGCNEPSTLRRSPPSTPVRSRKSSQSSATEEPRQTLTERDYEPGIPNLISGTRFSLWLSLTPEKGTEARERREDSRRSFLFYNFWVFFS